MIQLYKPNLNSWTGVGRGAGKTFNISRTAERVHSKCSTSSSDGQCA